MDSRLKCENPVQGVAGVLGSVLVSVYLKSIPPGRVGGEGAAMRKAGGQDRMTQAYYWVFHNKASLRICVR